METPFTRIIPGIAFPDGLERVVTFDTPPRTDTLLNELRALLANYTPAERVAMFEMIADGYCWECGRVMGDGRCGHGYPPETPEARSGVIDSGDEPMTDAEWLEYLKGDK